VRWNPNAKGFNDSEKKREALDRYLAVVDTLFAGKETVAAAGGAAGGSGGTGELGGPLFMASGSRGQAGQEAALYFLHQCGYDIPAATKLLKPWGPPVEEDEGWDDDGDEMFPADDYCSVCRDGGNLLMCDVCTTKAYHPACVQLESVPSGQWSCPYHSCSECAASIELGAVGAHSCAMCPTAYCARHVPPDLKIRAETLGALEPLCHACLGKEEEYAMLQADKGHSAPGYSCRRAFLHRLQMVLKRDSRQLVRMPIIGQREFDLYLLYTEVCKRGGIAAVIAAGASAWRGIRRALRLPPTVYHQAALLRRFYLQLLYQYEKQFFPHFRPLPLKSAHAAAAEEEKENNDEEDEMEELQAQAAQAQAAAVAAASGQSGAGGPKKKRGPMSAAAVAASAAALEEFFLPATDPSLKDDSQPDDVLLSLRVGASLTAMGSSKSKETKTKKRKQAKQLEDQAKKKQKAKHKRGPKEKDSKANGRAASQRNQRSRRDPKRGRSPTPAASAAAAASSTGPQMSTKGHLCTNIYAATPWAIHANSAAAIQRQNQHAAELAAAAAAAAASLSTEAVVAAQGAIDAAAMQAALTIAASSTSPSFGAAGHPAASSLDSLALDSSAALADDALSSKRKYQEMLLSGAMSASAAMAAAAATAAVAAAATVGSVAAAAAAPSSTAGAASGEDDGEEAADDNSMPDAEDEDDDDIDDDADEPQAKRPKLAAQTTLNGHANHPQK
jgi:hypothetical protein